MLCFATSGYPDSKQLSYPFLLKVQKVPVLMVLSSVLSRPPALRGAGANATPGANFSLAYDNSSKPGKIGSGNKNTTPGAEFVSKAAAKNAKKRAAKKGKAGGAGGDEEEEEQQQQQHAGENGASCSGSQGQGAGAVAAATEVRGRGDCVFIVTFHDMP